MRISEQVTSFDIFNTLITRLQTYAQDRYRFAYRSIRIQDKKVESLEQLRIQAEDRLAARFGPDLYSLDAIYDEMVALDQEFSSLKKRAREAELEMERAQCFAISRGKVLLERAKSKSRIIYTSDMYLPPEFLQELLERNGLWTAGARLFVSHAEGCAKHSGLFGKICREMRIQPGQLTHVGDNLRSDIEAPRRSGIHAVLIQPGKETRYETKIRNAGLGSLADAIRAVRLRGPGPAGSAEETVWQTACGVAAPLFIAYVVWLRQKACGMRLGNLFFISRDGLIFKKIYDQLPSQGVEGPSSHYLYGSRQAWICARLARLTPDDASFLTLPNPTLSFSQFTNRCNLEPKELGLPPWDAQGQLGQRTLDEEQRGWISTQISLGPWREKIQKRAEQRLAEVRAYFRQKGVGKKPFALVDLGWFGNLQEYLTWILPETPPQHGFYLDLRKMPRIQRTKKASAFLQSDKILGIDRSTSITLLEILSTAPHGSCRGYRSSGGTWEPDLEREPGFFADSGMIERQHEAILEVVSALVRLEPDLARLPLQKWREVAQQNFVALMKNPSPHEAGVLGAASFVSRQEGGVGVEFGPACSLPQAWNTFWQGFRVREAAWPQAMIRRSHGMSRLLLALRHGLGQAKARAESLFRA